LSAKKNIFQTVASSWLSLVIVSLCQLVTIPIALGALDKADFALFAVISQMMVAIMLAEVGVRSACARLLIDARVAGDAKYQKVWMASACVFCTQALVMLLIVLCLAPFLENLFQLNEDQISIGRSIFLVVGILKAGSYVLSMFSMALMAGQLLSRINLISTLSSVIQLAIFAVSIWMGAALWAYPLGMAGSVICQNSLTIGQANKHGLIAKFDLRKVEWSEVKGVFSLGFDVFVAAMFSVVMGSSLLLFSGNLLTLEETAVLAVNLKLVNLMTQILQRIPGSSSPMLMKMVSEGEMHQFRVWWRFIAKVTISLSLFSAGMYILWSGHVVQIWTSEEMVMRGGALILLSLIPFRYLAHYMFVNSLTIFKEVRKVKLALLWEIALYVGLSIYLGGEYGMLGLLSANLLSMLGGALFRGIRFLGIYSDQSSSGLMMLFCQLVVPLSASYILIALCIGVMGIKGFAETLVFSGAWLVVAAGMIYFVIFDQEERQKLVKLSEKFTRKLIR